MTFDLPEPPSVNAMWRHTGKYTYLSKRAKEYKDRVRLIGKAAKVTMIRGKRVRVAVEWRRKRRSGDLDNRLKLAIDSLQGVAFENDSQVVEIHAYRKDDKDNPGVTVTVEEAA